MIRDDIISIARQVWGDDSGKPWSESALLHLERFAELLEAKVRADERKKCAALCSEVAAGRDAEAIEEAILARGEKTDREIMQQALEALDYISRRDYDDTPLHDYELEKMRPAMSTLRERLAQPGPRNQCGEACERAKLCAVCLAEITKQPEQTEREWQGLTDEEISAISKSIPSETVLGAAKLLFARAIEDKLKEKND